MSKEITGILEGDKLAKKLEEATMSITGVCTQFNFLMGKVLTIIDASISDERQNKALKDLIKNSFHEQMDWATKVSTGHFGLIGVNEEQEKQLEEVNQ